MLDIAVLETRWWNESNDSVRGLFDMLAGILEGNPFGYHYEMFNNAPSIKEIIPRVAKDSSIHHLYIAAHGDETHIHGAGDELISRTVLVNLLSEIHAKQLYGVYFGCCQFGWQVPELMERATGPTWMAGYTEDVDWVHSSAMDLVFLARVLLERRGGAHEKSRPIRCHALFPYRVVDPHSLPLSRTWVRSEPGEKTARVPDVP